VTGASLSSRRLGTMLAGDISVNAGNSTPRLPFRSLLTRDTTTLCATVPPLNCDGRSPPSRKPPHPRLCDTPKSQRMLGSGKRKSHEDLAKSHASAIALFKRGDDLRVPCRLRGPLCLVLPPVLFDQLHDVIVVVWFCRLSGCLWTRCGRLLF